MMVTSDFRPEVEMWPFRAMTYKVSSGTLNLFTIPIPLQTAICGQNYS